MLRLSFLMFENFTMRTSPREASSFRSEPAFTWRMLLTPDPTGSLFVEEFLSWAFLTLILCFIHYMYQKIKTRVFKYISKNRQVEGSREGKKERVSIK